MTYLDLLDGPLAGERRVVIDTATNTSPCGMHVTFTGPHGLRYTYNDHGYFVKDEA